jgi:hypothetical protein
MPFNLLKTYPELLELAHLDERERKVSLMRIFNRDIGENDHFNFRTKTIRPTKKEGEHPLSTLFRHLTTRQDKDEKGKNLSSRSFELHRSERLHWIKYHIEEMKPENIEVFSNEDRIDRKDIIRTYIYDKVEEYVIILEPQRTQKDYYLLTAYHLNEPGGKKQIKKKLKKKLEQVF